MKVLVAENNLADRLILRRHLLSMDHEVIFALDGQEAIELFQREDPDLVIVDVLMPGMDGYEVCSRLKNVNKAKDIPVIFITAKTEVEDELKGLDLGAVDYITKPISPPVVKARVETHLSLKKAREILQIQNEKLKEAARLREDVNVFP